MEEPIQSAPSYEDERLNYGRNQRELPKEDEQRAAEDRRRDYSDYVRRRYEESRRRRSSGEEPLEIDVADAKNLSYRDMVRAPRKKSRETFIREANRVVVAEEMPWRKEVREVNDKRQLTPDEEQDARPSSPRSELGKAQYLELVVPPSKKAMEKFADETETTGRMADEMPWRKEVKEIRRSPSGEDPPVFMSFTQTQPAAELTRIRPPSLKTRDTFLTTQDGKNEEEMPWRKEVRELKERPRTEGQDDYRDESPPPELDFSTAPNLRKLSYKEFIKVPSLKRRDVFQGEAENEKDKEEMPWRKEVREIKRTLDEEEQEQVQKSPATIAHSSPELDFRGPAYHELVAKPPRKPRDSFVPYEGKQREEMPWRKEVREIKRTVTEDEQVPRSSAANVHYSSEDTRDLRKFSYRDFVGKPRKKSESFLPSEQKEKEEMPWRKEVRELRGRPAEEEKISQSSRSELDSVPSDYRNFESSSQRIIRSEPETNLQNAYYEDTRYSSRNAPYSGRQSGVQNLSYRDFISPSSKASEPQGQVQRRSTKVKDLTQRFAKIEAEKNRPKESGPPSRKSLVDVAELQRLERDMKTRSWHGFPSAAEYDSDDEYDVGRLRRTRSQEEEEERLRQQHQRENVSGLEELDDVFQDPEGYFEQMQGPPPGKNVEKDARVQYEAPSWKERGERKEQVVTIRSTNEYDRYRPPEQYGQATLYAAHRDDYYQKHPDREESKRKPSDDRVVVKQSWIQPNRVELGEASLRAPEYVEKRNTKEEYIPKDTGPYIPNHHRNERPYFQGYQKSEPYEPNRDGPRDEDTFYHSEDKCFIEESDSRENQPYYPGHSDYRDQNQIQKENEYWIPREMRSLPREQRSQPVQTPAKDDGAMVFGGPIVVTATRSQQSGKPEGVRNRGTYDFVPAEVRPTENRNDTVPDKHTEERSYYNRDGNKSMQDENIQNARNLVLQDIRNFGKKGVVQPLEEPKMAYRPQVFGVFARTDRKETQKRDDLHEHQSSELPLKETEDSFQETQLSNMRYLDESHQDKVQDWKTADKRENDSWYVESRPQRDEEGYDYENSASNHTELHPTVVSMVESQTEQWGSGAFDASPQKDEQRTGRRRVMDFSNDDDEDVPSEKNDDVFQTAAEPVQVEVHEVNRRREQKEKEEMVREQLRDAEYREKYRKEFEEKNRKQRENSKYLMSLQMRAALGSDEDGDYGEDGNIQREDGKELHLEQQQSQDYNWTTDEDLVKAVAAEEDYWHHKMEKKVERESRGTNRNERPRRKKSDESQPRINGIDFVGEDGVVHREYKDYEHEARLRKLKAEEEFMAQEADRLMRERAAMKQQSQVEEAVISPVEKPPVEFTINEETLNSFLTEDKKEEDFYDENRNRNLPKTLISEQRDIFCTNEEYPPQQELEVQDKGRQYSDKTSKPQAEVLPINGYHHDTEVYPKTPAEILRQNGDQVREENSPGHSGTDPEENGFEGYSIYETFIHGESNHVICMSCGTSIEKSPAMYIAELDRYWHVNCFSCVVCRAWFGDEYSPVLHITKSMLHCERCYITSEGKLFRDIICAVRCFVRNSKPVNLE